MRSVFDIVTGFFNTGVQIVEGEQAGDGDRKTAGGSDECFSHTTRDLSSGRGDIARHVTEGTHHTGNGTEKTEQRSGGNHGVESRETLIEAIHFLIGCADERSAEAVFLVGESVGDNASDEVIALLAELNGAFDVAVFNLIENLFHHVVIAGGVLADDEDQTLDDNS